MYPCKDCDKRSEGCHGRCSEYIAEKERQAEEKKKIRLEKEYKCCAKELSLKRRKKWQK